nr:CASP-like protein 4C2 [Tanacetum cinerariifolium]
TVSQRNLSRFNYTILIFRLTSFCFSLSAAVFMFTINITAAADSPRWYNFGAFRFIVAANAIIAFYSLFEIVASIWEIYRGFTLFPECSQVFAYLLLSAGSAGTELVRQLREVGTCTDNNAFCIQSDIALALGYVLTRMR